LQEEVIVAKQRKESRLRQGASIAGSGLKRLRQEDHTWEADFRALPKPILETETHYLGLVVSKESGSVLAHSQVEGRPAASDLAALLADAMRRPLTGAAHRPHRLHLRGHRQWQELFTALQDLGIDVMVQRELPRVKAAYEDHLRQMRDAGRAGMVRPTKKQGAVEVLFPAIAKWVQGYGHIEVGDQESFGFLVRALDYGGLVFEDDKADTLAEAMVALEKGLAEYFEREGIK
jgi:hypothetical protein